MCGIAGIIDFGAREVGRDRLEAFREELAHRGPDDSGIHEEPHVGLVARRLSILDLSARGHMPMSNADDSMWIVYNGEAYNFAEVRAELEAAGRTFDSDCDTEVVLRAYEHWGDDCVHHLSGMYAFAIWDRRRERLFAARDRMGVKPLILRQTGSRLEFCSEGHPLLRTARLSAEDVDLEALAGYLACGYVPADRSIVQGLTKLPPGHRLVFDREGLKMDRYWQPAFRPTRSMSVEEALEGVEEMLEAAVRRRLRSDVPFGCFLSGGIDSGLVVALALETELLSHQCVVDRFVLSRKRAECVLVA